jgi:hypothetical protein
MRIRQRYIPIIEAEGGMVLRAAANAVSGGALSFSLPAGHVLTEDNLHQLNAHRVEFIFVTEPDLRTDQEVAADAALVARQVMRIFAGADLSDSTMAELFDQVLAYRSA